MKEFNLSGTLNVLRLLREPSLCLPHYTCATFNHLPIPLSKAFPGQNGEKDADIRAVILDKDNCFATPHTNHVYPKYKVIILHPVLNLNCFFVFNYIS